MSKNRIGIPESYRYYMKNSSALEQLRSFSNSPPRLAWECLKDFYHALFSLEVVYFEYYMFLRDLWSATWGEAVRDCNLIEEVHPADYKCKESPYGKSSIPLSPKEVFSDMLARIYRVGEHEFILGVFASEDSESLRLWWWSTGGDKDSDESWEQIPNSVGYCTRKGLCPLDQNSADVSILDLHKQAVELIEKMK